MNSYDNYSKLKETRNVTDFAVSKATGIAPSTLSEWKTGKSEPKTDKMQKIADFFDVSIDYILSGKDTVKTSTSGREYYFDDESAEIAQELFENKDMRILFSAARDCDAETLKKTYDMLKILKGTNDE